MKIETVIQKFTEIREKRAILKRAYEEEDFKLKEAMSKMEGWMLNKMNEQGVESFRTEHGTAYTTLDVRASCADWPSLWQWMALNGEFSMLEKRVSIGAVKEYEERTGSLPPYINKMTERVVRVRRN